MEDKWRFFVGMMELDILWLQVDAKTSPWNGVQSQTLYELSFLARKI